jgi:hypothetical protein
MHRLTALELRSGVKSSSAISTQPSERTANRMARESRASREDVDDNGAEGEDSDVDGGTRAAG